jgi:hypothetical protein
VDVPQDNRQQIKEYFEQTCTFSLDSIKCRFTIKLFLTVSILYFLYVGEGSIVENSIVWQLFGAINT